MMLTTDRIVAAWYSVADEWIVRQHWKYKDGKQWEVVHDWGGDTISEDTQKVICRFGSMEDGEAFAKGLENEARARAVLALLQKENNA